MARKGTGLVKKAEVEEAIRHYKPYMGLADWQHTLTMDPSVQGEEIAAVSVRPDWKTFSMVFAPRVFARAKATHPRFVSLEGVVLHELLHVAVWPLIAAAGCQLPEDHVEPFIRWVEEPFIDPLARTLARYLPRPRP